MSFILDALRKSEHDRQRQTGPGLAEVPMAQSRPKKNVWATAAVALLIVNLVGVGVLLWRRASHETPTATPTAPASAVTAPQTPPAAATSTATPPPPTLAPQAVTQALPQPVLQPRPVPAAPPGRNPLESEVSGGPQGLDEGIAAHAASVPQQSSPAVSRTTTIPASGGSARYEPIPQATVARAVAAETQSAPPQQQPQHSSLPTADELSAGGGVPQLHLDLHVFSTKPQERFIFVNSHKYREGDTLQEGPVVEQITQNGAVLNYRGSRFLLTRD